MSDEQGHVSVEANDASSLPQGEGSAPEVASQPPPAAPVVETEEDRYIKVVTERPSDFDTWEVLLQTVVAKEDAEKITAQFDAFLGYYPFCFAYWKKYSDAMAKVGGDVAAKEVLERGVCAVKSVDLWVHYCLFSSQRDPVESVEQVFERAIAEVGLDFYAAKLWDTYLQWLLGKENVVGVYNTYVRVMAVPLQEYKRYLKQHDDFVAGHSVTSMVDSTKLAALNARLRETHPDMVEGDSQEEEFLKALLIQDAHALHATTEQQYALRYTLEAEIKRPYFHVKPLEEDGQQAWRNYLAFEEQQAQGAITPRLALLLERCVVTCAYYPEFWLKYANLMEAAQGLEAARGVLTRAAKVMAAFDVAPPSFHYARALVEEQAGNISLARSIYDGSASSSTLAALVETAVRYAAFEARNSGPAQALAVLDKAAETLKADPERSFLAMARAQHHVQHGTPAAARQIVQEAIAANGKSKALYVLLLDIEFSQFLSSKSPAAFDAIIEVFNMVERSDLDEEAKRSFVARRFDFLNTHSTSIADIRAVDAKIQRLAPTFPAASSLKRPLDDAGYPSGKRAEHDHTQDQYAQQYQSWYSQQQYSQQYSQQQQYGQQAAYGSYPASYSAPSSYATTTATQAYPQQSAYNYQQYPSY